MTAMASVCLVACVRSKRQRKARAEELYDSPLFEKSRKFAVMYFDHWYILSAKYGLLDPRRMVAPYEVTLNKMSRQERSRWARKVCDQIREHTSTKDNITFLAGSRYRQELLPLLRAQGYDVRVPLKGLSIGKQLQWLARAINDPEHLQHLDKLYALLEVLEEGLGGKRLLRECHGKMDWPDRGVYFLFEPRERRLLDPDALRVVRVGTHMVSAGSNATLWNRLRTHRGTVNGLGNHRSSILRLHIGSALLRRPGAKLALPTWGRGEASAGVNRTEATLEKRVSEYVGGMSLLFVAVGDEPGPASDRAYLEKNTIGLLAGPRGPIDIPSRRWLGLHCPNEMVQKSGLWNVDYTTHSYDPCFLDVLSAYVGASIGQAESPQGSIAPRDWHSADKGKNARGQTYLFEWQGGA